MSHVAIVLAAGQGTRMKSPLPKACHLVAGRPMLGWALEAVAATGPSRTLVVVGHRAELVEALLPPGVESCLQSSQLGTGHATLQAVSLLGTLDPETTVLVVPGDAPMMSAEVLSGLLSAREDSGADLAILTADLADPTGYGRVVRNPDSSVQRVVEQRDADPATLAITEVNAGFYAFAAETLVAGLAALSPDNDQGELYLTDLVGITVGSGGRVLPVSADESVVSGINTQTQLAAANTARRRAILEEWMVAGVAVTDPDRTYVDFRVELAAGVQLYPGVHLEGATVVGSGAVVGPDVFAIDATIGPGARVWYAVLRQAEVGPGCEVGPYASLRPGTVLRQGAKAGTFVELKQTVVGEDAKVPHLSYLGDAIVGAGANVGAGTITCNFDGHQKHQTRIGEGAFVGSNTMLVAPVSIGAGAVTGAGSVITKDVEDGALGLERSPQRNLPGYAAKRRARYRAAERDQPTEGH